MVDPYGYSAPPTHSMNLACRNCRVRLDAESGCAICDPIRRHLVTVDEDDADRPDLADVGSETVAALRARLKHVRKRLENDANDEGAAKLLISLANSLAKVIESARKLQVDAEGAIRAMSFVARAKLFVGWYAALPPPYRVQLREQLDRFELEAAKPVKELPSG